MIKKYLPLLIAPVFFRKVFAFGLLFLIGYLLSDFLMLFFIIFIFAYLFLEVGTWLAHKVHRWGLVKKETRAGELARKYSNTNIAVTLLYIIFITVVVFLFVTMIPQIVREVGQFVNSAPRIAATIQNFMLELQTKVGIDLGIQDMLSKIVSADNFEKLGQTLLHNLTNAGAFLTKFLIGLLLSYIFVMERRKILTFLQKLREGNFAFLYYEYANIAKKMVYGFGVIFKAQSIIALVNAILTTLGLFVISIIHLNQGAHHMFPFIFTLSLIVLIFGFIPVFGTFLSGVPIVLIALGYGGWVTVLEVVIMISIVHAVEAYYLNPKIVSGYIHFPVFITFLILLVSEHFFGIVGLLIGVPIFVILLSFGRDFDIYLSDVKRKVHAPREN